MTPASHWQMLGGWTVRPSLAESLADISFWETPSIFRQAASGMGPDMLDHVFEAVEFGGRRGDSAER